MDLGAYKLMIEIDTNKLLNNLNINIMRLRGIRFMEKEEKISEEEIQERIKHEKIYTLEKLLKYHSLWIWDSDQDEKKHPAFIYGYDEYGNKNIVDYDFSKVHGKTRKRLKFEFKKIEKRVKAQYDLFNKYVGQKVLYIHARQGGGNRTWCKMDEVAKHPLYLGDVDDSFDCTYCDIYFNINNINLEKYEVKENEIE